MLGYADYDGDELREKLDERETKPVIPNRSNRIRPFSFIQASLAHRERLQQTEGLQTHRNPL